MKSFIKMILFISCITHHQQKAHGSDNLSFILMEVFGGQCRSLGAATNEALASAKSLISVFEQLQSDPDCIQTSGSIDALSIFSEQLENESNTPSYFDVVRIERSIEDLTSSLNAIDDETLQANITTELMSLRLELITTKATFKAEQRLNRGRRQRRGYYLLTQSLRDFYGYLPNLQKCAQKSPGRLIQILGKSFAAGSFFANPVLSMGISGLATVGSMATDAIYQAVQSRRVQQITDSLLPAALSCAVETLSDLYCEAKRSEELVRKYANFQESDIAVWRGIPLIFRKLEPFLEWLELVRTGTKASDTFDAQRRINVINQGAQLDTIRIQEEGTIAETDAEIPGIDRGLDIYIQQQITAIVRIAQASAAVNTLNDSAFLPFRLIGFSKIPLCQPNPNLVRPCQNLADFVLLYQNSGGSVGYTITLDDWEKTKTNINIILREAIDFANTRINRVSNEDLQLTLLQAYVGFEGNESPLSLIVDVQKYLNGLKTYLISKNTDDRYEKYIFSVNETNKIFESVRVLLDEWDVSSASVTPDQSKYIEILSKISDIFKLKRGTQYFINRIRKAVTMDIIAHMENGELGRDLKEVIDLNNNDVISDITAYKLFDMHDMVQDAVTAKGVIKNNIKVFFKNMRKQIYRAMEIIEYNGIDPMVKEKFCIHLLSSDLFRKRSFSIRTNRRGKKLYDFCKGISMKSIFDDDALAVKFDEYIDNQRNYTQPFEDRVCLYNNFMRKVRIRERFKENRVDL